MSRLPLRTSLFPYTTLFRSEGMELTQALPWERAEADAIAALGALRAHGAVDESRVGLAGFCYGGGLAFAATASAAEEGRPPAALISYYGSALDRKSVV